MALKFRPKKIVSSSPPKPRPVSTPSRLPSAGTVLSALPLIGGLAATGAFFSNESVQEALSFATDNPLVAGGALLALLILLK
jgi:hypothetical protein